MATLRDIKRRINGVKNTQQITKAMKMVAAAKLRRAQENIINARPYSRKIFDILAHLISDDELEQNPFFSQKKPNTVLLVVVTADRGLCGAFNTNIIRESERLIKEEFLPNNIKVKLFTVGKKSTDYFKKRNYDVLNSLPGIFTGIKYEHAVLISEKIISEYLNGSYEKVFIIYNEFKSIIQQKIVNEQFLPIPVSEILSGESNTQRPNYIFEPNQKFILEYLLPKHLKAQIWRVLLESNASELGARMTAMDNATTNATEMIRSLQLTYNKERQAAITKEILEIVSGANALKAG